MTQPVSREVRILRKIDSSKFSKDFAQNMIELNASVDTLAKFQIVMQGGIDDANKDFIQKIQDFINDLIIIFSGGEDTGFDFGDLKYIIQALGALFGFDGSGPINLIEAAIHFIENFAADGVIGFVVQGIIDFIQFLLSFLGWIPGAEETLSDATTKLGQGLAQTHSNAQQAQNSADVAYGNSTVAYNAATAASTAASTAANAAAAAEEKADIAYGNAQYWKDEFMVSSSNVSLGYNEVELGVVMDKPDDGIGRTRKITAVRYGMKANTGTLTIKLMKTPSGSSTPVEIHSTNVPSAVTKLRDNSPDIVVNDGDYISCNVTAISGNVTVLQCALIGVLISDETP